jgi:parvulin-like peptidyl-prolyl isomerase
MSMAMNPLAKFAVPGFLLFFAGLCFPQSDVKIKLVPPNASSAQPQLKSAKDETIPPADPNAIFPAVVARVNGEAIFGRDLDALVLRELRSNGTPEWRNLGEEYWGELTLKKITLLIKSKLVCQKVAASGIKVTDAEVRAELQKIAKTFKSNAEMDAALASQKIDRAFLEKSVRENLTMSKYVKDTINKKIVVTPEELATYYLNNRKEFYHPDIVRTSHILIQVAGDTPEQDAMAKQRAEALLVRIKKGEDFAKLAKENSMDLSASQGGDIGFTSKEGLAPEYSKAAFSLPIGGIQLVKTRQGYYIIKVMDKKNEGLFTLKEVKPQLNKKLKDQRCQKELNKLINQLWENANIEILISIREPLNP